MPASKRKPGRGGARPGAGRPPGLDSAVLCIAYRITPQQWLELATEAQRLGLKSPDLAAKRRAFPVQRQDQ